MAIGQKRGDAKKAIKDEKEKEGEKYNPTKDVVPTIHSLKSRQIYMEHINHFIDWCINEKGVNKYATLDKIKPLAQEYLKEREEQGKSLATLKAERAALGKLYGETIEYKFAERGSKDKITRDRDRDPETGQNNKEYAKHFSEEKNRDLVNIAKGTGARRADIESMKRRDFMEDKHGNLWVKIKESKGGRDRWSPVLPEYQNEIKDFLQTKRFSEPLFDHVHGAADIHGYRESYSKELLEEVGKNPDFKNQCLEFYENRNHPYTPETYKNRDGKQVEVKSETYKPQNRNGAEYDRQEVFIVSQALGHNRLSVSINHYIDTK